MWAVRGMEWANTGEDGDWKNALTCRSEVWVYRKGRWEQSEDDGKISSTYGNLNPFWVILDKFPIILFKMLISILNKCCIQSYLPSDSQILVFTLLREQKYIGDTRDIENLCLIEKISGGQVMKGQKQSSLSSFISNQIAVLIFRCSFDHVVPLVHTCVFPHVCMWVLLLPAPGNRRQENSW